MLSTFPRLALVGLTLFCTVQVQAGEPTTAPVPEKSLIERGQYVARLGDCIACHTALGGAVMAGGLELKTPMGTIYSSNITPDRGTGIGAYTIEQFDRVMRQRYPAIPGGQATNPETSSRQPSSRRPARPRSAAESAPGAHP